MMNKEITPAQHFINNAWRRSAGLDEVSEPVTNPNLLQDLRNSEWSTEFEELMRSRLILGALRYGKLGDPNKPTWDRVSDIHRRLDVYSKDGNLEHLVDCANLLLCEFVEGKHTKKHFKDSGDDYHTQIK